MTGTSQAYGAYRWIWVLVKNCKELNVLQRSYLQLLIHVKEMSYVGVNLSFRLMSGIFLPERLPIRLMRRSDKKRRIMEDICYAGINNEDRLAFLSHFCQLY